MKVEMQGKGECLLATIAALKGVSLASVRARACQIACTDIEGWNRVATSDGVMIVNGKWTNLFWFSIDILCRELDMDSEQFKTKVNAPALTSDGPVSLPEGRGIIIIRITREFDRITSHISPFENGRIFDPAKWGLHAPNGETLEDYLIKWQGEGKIEILKIAHA